MLLVTSDVAFAGEPIEPARPNIILINLDDADVAMLSDPMLADMFPNLHRIAREGTRFTNCHAATPLCGPSRASLLSGRLPLRSQIRVNSADDERSNGFRSGYDTYRDLGYLLDDLPMQMRAAGYRPAHVGKYLHPNFDTSDRPNWDHFFMSAGARYHGTHFMRSVNGEPMRIWRSSPDSYRTQREAGEVLSVLQQTFDSTNSTPLFLYWAPIAPHTGAPSTTLGLNSLTDMIEARYRSSLTKVFPPLDASVNEPDMRDKHPVLEHLSDISLERMEEYYRSRLLAIKSFDDQLGRVIRELESRDQYENTYMFVTSDNGYTIGHHRLVGKFSPYERSTNIPLFVRGPGIPEGVVGHHLLSHIDLFPTLIELAGADVPGFADGKSFLPLLFDAEQIDEPTWQDAILIQNFEPMVDSRRDVEIPFVYSQLRMYDATYTEYADGYREYYDLRVDPLELVNLYDALPGSRKRYLEHQLSTIARPATVEATIRSPSATFLVGKQNLRLVGYAVSSRPIQAVRYVARIPELGIFWTGDGWTLEPTGVEARQLDDAKLLARWEDQIDTNDLPPGLFTLVVRPRAFDVRNNPPSLINERRYVLDTERPTADIVFPAAGKVERGPVVIRGTVSDNVGVAAVHLRIMHIPTRRFWNGTEFQAGSVRVPASLDLEKGEWSYRFPESRGQYRVFVEAVDTAGNWQASWFARKILLRQ